LRSPTPCCHLERSSGASRSDYCRRKDLPQVQQSLASWKASASRVGDGSTRSGPRGPPLAHHDMLCKGGRSLRKTFHVTLAGMPGRELPVCLRGLLLSAMARTYHVYILSNRHRSVLYIGVTGHLARRLRQHKKGIGSAFTKRYNVTDLIYAESYAQVDDALRREKQLKRWTRQKKLTLVRCQNPTLETLPTPYE